MNEAKSSQGYDAALSGLVFLDTEFTDFKNPKLLSLGLVSWRWLRRGHRHSEQRHASHQWIASAPTHLYLETTDQNRLERVSMFCKETVLPQFGLVEGCGVASDVDVGARVGEWIRVLLPSGDAPLVVVYDYPVNYELLMKALHSAGQMRGEGSLLGRLRALDIEDKASVFAYLNDSGAMDLSRRGLAKAHRAFEQADLAALEFFDGAASDRGGTVPFGAGRHHALVDAMALAHRWKAMVSEIAAVEA